MKVLFKPAAFVLCCILVLSLLAGCGKQVEIPTKEGTVPGTAASSSAPESKPASPSTENPTSPAETETKPDPIVPDVTTAPESTAAPAELFEQQMEEIFSLPPEQEPSGDSGAISLDAQILSQVSWEIVSQDNNNVEIAVAAPDVKAILGSQATELLSQPDGVEQILALLNQDNLPMTSTTVSVTLDENGVPTDAFPLTDAIYGGLLSLLEEIYASMEASK